MATWTDEQIEALTVTERSRHTPDRTCPICGMRGRLKYAGGTTYTKKDGTTKTYRRWKCKDGCQAEWTAVNGMIPVRTVIVPEGGELALRKLSELRDGPAFLNVPDEEDADATEAELKAQEARGMRGHFSNPPAAVSPEPPLAREDDPTTA